MMAPVASAHNRVLVVEDDVAVRRSVVLALQRHGCEVFDAADVDGAVDLARQNQFTCAVIDWTLRRQSGLSVLEHLRTQQPDCVRILMTGGNSGEVFIEAVSKGGVAGIVRKPFSVNDLLSVIDRNVRERARVGSRDRQLEKNFEEALVEPMGMALQAIVDDTRPGPQAGRCVVAYEALLRPKHPVLNRPPALLTAAEKLGRVHDVGALALALAASRLAALPPGVQLFVNLHPEQLADRARLEQAIVPFANDTERVVFEITERQPLDDSVFAQRTVDLLRERGFSIAVDDFGSGYSSLAMVADLEPDYIKLDMSLVRALHRFPRRMNLVQTFQRFADSENTQIIAEGVETADEVYALRDCNVRLMQGFLFSRPTESESEPS